MARTIRCSYCYGQGHSRNNCPTAKQAAQSGDSYAQKVVERSKVKQCSYCRNTDHTKATCEKLYVDERLAAERKWCGVLGLIEVVKSKKIAAGAFIYGPVSYYGGMPDEEGCYEFINYCIEEVSTRNGRTDREHTPVIKYSTLAEPTVANTHFRGWAPMPDLYNAVHDLQTEFTAGKSDWLKANETHGYMRAITGRQRLANETVVLVPAEDAAVEQLVSDLLSLKPLILKSDDRKSFQRAQRAENKAKKVD